MKKLYFLIILFITALGFGQSTGDIAFVSFNADGDDDFAIVALADIPASTTIYFSDDELDGAGGFASSGEGNIQWDTPASIITAGTVVTFIDTDSGTNPSFGTSHGTLTYVGNGTVNLSGGGDGLFAYLGTDQENPTTFLAGIQNGTSAALYGDLTASGLTIGTTYVVFTTSGTPDGGEYTGSRDSQTSFANYLPLIGDPSNWTTETSNGENILPLDTTAFVEATIATPLISAGPDVSGLNYFENNEPSNEGSFTVSGSDLMGAITVTAPANFELSLTSGGTFTNSVMLAESGGTVLAMPIYVRLQAGLVANTYMGDATASSTGATSKTVAISGIVNPDDPQISTSGSILDLEYTFGSGPSSDDSFGVSALFLTTHLTITAPTDFEVSLSSGTGFAASVSITPDGSGTVTSTDIFVRLKSGLAIGNYMGDVTASSPGATNRTEAANGNVNPVALCAPAGSVIITEVMQNPAAAVDPAGEYFELHNTTAEAIDLQGWVIKDDVTASESHTIATSLSITAGGYIVIGNSSTSTPTLDYSYNNDISLGNSTDGLIIECSGTIDQVIWDNGATFPDPSGSSMELGTSRLNASDNDLGANWGVATTDIGNGDLGSPGVINDFVLSTDSFEIDEFSLHPNPTDTDYVSISSSNEGAMNIKVYDILGKQVKNEVITNTTLNVSSLKSGIYIIKITQNTNSTTKKLVIR